MKTFTLTRNEANGTSLRGYFRTSYKKLEEAFGCPDVEGEFCITDGKTSTEWEFKDEDGNIATLYDYKETSEYERGYPSVKQFRSRPSYNWHIGAESDEVANNLIEFLKSKNLLMEAN